MKSKPPKVTRAQLERRLLEANAGQAHVYSFATAQIDKTSTKYLMASGVVLQLSFLGGKDAFAPVLIRDGLSEETIEAIKRDLKRSYETATAFTL